MAETAIWTVLPAGLDETGDLLRLTIFVSPRLTTGGGIEELGTFAAFANWPATVAGTAFELHFDGFGVFSAAPDPDTLEPDPTVWERVLPPETQVGSHDFSQHDLSDRIVRSFPAGPLAEYLEDFYRTVASTSPTEFGAVTTGPVAGLVDDLRLLAEGDSIVDSLLPPKQGGGMPPVRFVDQSALGAQATGLGFAQARRFYHRPASTDPLGPNDVPDEPTPPPLEFHSVVAFMGDYPKLLRRLALAIDVVVEAGAIAPGVGRVQLVPPGGLPLDDLGNAALTPWTHYRLDDPLFIPRPRLEDKVGDFEDGMVRLEDAELFRVSQIDIDGSALKVTEFAMNAARVQQHLAGKQRSMTPDEVSVPALRSTGFSVTRLNRAERVVAAFDEAADRQARVSNQLEVELFAEDVTRGFHVDVLDKSDWRSLCSRVGTYEAGGTAIPLPPDEGFIKAASVSEETDVGQGPPDDLYLHESFFGWDGWSLVAKRPGQPVVDDGAAPPDLKQTDATPLSTSFEPVPNSLPRLRYGRPYRFRARAVDLAGNRVADRAIDDEHITGQRHFWRFDPVPSPEVLPRRPFTEGESVLRMVVRSTLGITTDDYVALARIAGLAGHTDPLLAYTSVNQRHLAPPKTSQQMAEWHGMFDAAFGPGATAADLDQAFQIATRSDGTFMDAGTGAIVFQPSGAPPTVLDPLRVKGSPLEPGEYVLQTADLVDLPYLPDVFARGWSMTGLPGAGSTETFPWSGNWPDAQPVRVELSEGPAGFSLNGRVLSVSLPKAEIAVIRLSSYLDDADVGQMGVFRLVFPDPDAAISPAEAAYRDMAARGLNWLLTPHQTFVLVHAVEKPLEPPTVNVPSAGVSRRSGETFAVLTGTIDNHAKSTGRLDIDAVWTEPIDDPAKDTWETVSNGGHVGDFLIERTEDNAKVGRDDVAATNTHLLRHEFGDTKHRVVEYTATATTRYREYFPPEITDQTDLITHVGPPAGLSVPSSRRPDPPEVLYIVPTFTYTSGRTRFPSLPLLAETSPPPPTDVRRARTGPGRVLGSTRLTTAAGRPLDARFTPFERGSFATPLIVNTWQRRSGGGLRVYLDRPWFSSGEGELLGVVIKRQPWIHWPIDAGKGLFVSEAARLDALRFAEAVFANQLARPTRGTSTAAVSERLLRVLETTAGDGAGRDEVRSIVRSELGLEPLVSTAMFDRWVDVLLPRGDSSNYESRWGKDPIWGSARPDSGPTVSQFPLRTAVGYKVALQEAFADVTVVGHTPQFDPVRRLWYCDVEIEAGDSYTPFVKLGLVRYQPDSISGHHISRVVMADFVQLMPERVLTHSKRGSSLSVTLRGPGGYSHAAESVLGPTAAASPAGLSRSRFAEIQVERSSAPDSSDLSWEPVGDPVRLSIHANSTTDNVVYVGSIAMPTPQSGESLRVAVREFDILPTDPSEADAVLPDVPMRIFPRFRIEKYRLVYAAHITP